MNRVPSRSSVLLVSAVGLALQSAAAMAETPAADVGLEEVTVTAQRVSAKLQDVPLSVTALSASELQDRQVTSGLDMVRQVPNLVGSNNVGLGSAASFFLRGVGQDESISTSDPAVGVYVDGVYISRQIANNVLLYDLERVEVLRGPQGTLYGRNTSGGAIKFVTRKPGKEFTGYADISYESEYQRAMITASVEMPLSDTLSSKLTAVHSDQQKGFQKSRTTGDEFWAPQADGVRAQLRWTPNDATDITGTVEYLKDSGQEIVGQDRLNDNPGTFFSVLSGLRGQMQETKTRAASINATIDFGSFQLESISGVRSLQQTFLIDASDQVRAAYAIPNASTHNQWSQEFTFSGKAGAVDWLAGVFYMNERNRSFVGDELFLFGGIVAGNFMRDLNNNAKSSAAFAHATWHASDALSVTAGARYTQEKKTVDVQQYIVFPAAVPGTIANYAPASYPGARGPLLPFWNTTQVVANGTDVAPKFTKFDPKVGVDYKLSDDAMVFASFTKGFKSGGWNARVTDPRDFVLYRPESVTSIEVGLKSTWLDNSLRLNLTYFDARYKDFIVTAINPATNSFITVNAAKMHNRGVEGELAWQPQEAVTFFANFGTNDAKYTQSTTAAISLSNKVKRTPKATYSLGAELREPAGSGEVFANLWYSHQGEYYADLANSPYALVPSYPVLDASAGWESAEKDWRLSVSCKNCANKENFHSALVFATLGFATQYPSLPRQVFLSARYNFGGKR
jgi:iron complex outermembrane receptor protein